MDNLHLHIIANEHAGSGRGKESSEKIKRYLNEKKIAYSIYKSEYAGHTIELTKDLLQTTLLDWTPDHQKPYPLLVVLGGDGTVHEVVNTIGENTTIPIGYIPSGSGNDFARSVGIPREPIQALEKILHTVQPSPIYILKRLNHLTQETTYITNNLGIGVDAAIVNGVNESQTKKTFNKLQAGSLVYLLSAVKFLFKQNGFPLTVTESGKKTSFDNAFLVTCTKHPYFGGGVKIAPTASSFNDDVELIVVEKIAIIKIFYLITLLLQGKHIKSKHINHFKAKSIGLQVDSLQYGQMNGESIDKTTFSTEITTTKRYFWI